MNKYEISNTIGIVIAMNSKSFKNKEIKIMIFIKKN